MAWKDVKCGAAYFFMDRYRNKNFKIMSIVRYSTTNDFVPTSFSTLIDRFFNDSLSRSGGSAYSFVPKVDMVETEKA
mgnify:CR=1 FL=1